MPKMCAIPELVSPVLNPIPIVEHFKRSHSQCEHMRYSYRQCIWVEKVVPTMRPMMPVATVSASTSLTCGRCFSFTKTISKMPTKRIVFTYQTQNSLTEFLKNPLTFGSREKLWIKKTFVEMSGAPNEDIVQNHLTYHCWTYFSI